MTYSNEILIAIGALFLSLCVIITLLGNLKATKKNLCSILANNAYLRHENISLHNQLDHMHQHLLELERDLRSRFSRLPIGPIHASLHNTPREPFFYRIDLNQSRYSITMDADLLHLAHKYPEHVKLYIEEALQGYSEHLSKEIIEEICKAIKF